MRFCHLNSPDLIGKVASSPDLYRGVGPAPLKYSFLVDKRVSMQGVFTTAIVIDYYRKMRVK